jgi:hypothetical protein
MDPPPPGKMAATSSREAYTYSPFRRSGGHWSRYATDRAVKAGPISREHFVTSHFRLRHVTNDCKFNLLEPEEKSEATKNSRGHILRPRLCIRIRITGALVATTLRRTRPNPPRILLRTDRSRNTDSRRAGEKEHRGRSQNNLCGGKLHLEGSQASPARPSDKISAKLMTLGLLEAVA